MPPQGKTKSILHMTKVDGKKVAGVSMPAGRDFAAFVISSAA
jgi:hypothetical protein